MKRKIVFCLSFLCLIMGCSKTSVKSIDLDSLAQALVSEGSYDSTLVFLKEEEINSFYFFDETMVEKVIVSISTQNTADEVAIFKTKKSDEMKKVIEARLELQKSSFASYFPIEVPKLNDALIFMQDDLVILVISKDATKAKKIINEALK